MCIVYPLKFFKMEEESMRVLGDIILKTVVKCANWGLSYPESHYGVWGGGGQMI
jgi:hypothetical protein